MEALRKRESKSIPYKSNIFHVNSQEQKGDNKQVTFTSKQINGKMVIFIQSPLLEKDNFKVIHAGTRITLIISEKRSVEKPLYAHNVKINHLEYSVYERLKSFEYFLPSENYTHLDTKWNEQSKRIEAYFR